MLQVQEAENKLDAPKDAEEQPCDVNYLLPFSMSYLIMDGAFHYYIDIFIFFVVICNKLLHDFSLWARLS